MSHGLQRCFETFLAKKSQKLTQERVMILNHIALKKGHFDAESVYNDLKKKKARVARDTVFRTLPMLLEAGIIQKSVGAGKSDYYEFVDPDEGHHDHIICLKCEAVIEFYSRKIELDQIEICKEHDFELVHHDHRLYGYCKKCRNQRMH